MTEKKAIGKGLFLVLLGPDGCGKSTLAEMLVEDAHARDQDVYHFHWRPNLLPPLRRPRPGTSADAGAGPPPPPDDFAYGYTLSLIRYLYYLVDFILGYWVVIFPRKRNGMLVIGERWYLDILIHPARYGFRLPAWLLRFGGWLVPLPDMTILLEANPEVIFSRKPELSKVQIRDQLSRMRIILPKPPRGACLSTEGDLPIIFDGLKIILSRLEQPEDNGTSWAAFPTYRKTRIWIDNSSPLSTALLLYNPYSRPAKLLKFAVSHSPATITRLFFHRQPAEVLKTRLEDIRAIILRTLDNSSLSINFYIGTPGPHQKITAQAVDGNKVVSYIKTSSNTAVLDLLANESAMLKLLEERHFKGSAFPRTIAHNEKNNLSFLFFSPPNEICKPTPIEITQGDLRFISAMGEINKGIRDTKEILDILGLPDDHSCSILNEAIAFINKYTDTTGIVVHACHGDYAPWNTLQREDDTLHVFDWEYARPIAPALLDLFHRIFMPGRLVSRMHAENVIKQLVDIWSTKGLRDIPYNLGISREQSDTYILLYLLYMATWDLRNSANISGYLCDCFSAILAKEA